MVVCSRLVAVALVLGCRVALGAGGMGIPVGAKLSQAAEALDSDSAVVRIRRAVLDFGASVRQLVRFEAAAGRPLPIELYDLALDIERKFLGSSDPHFIEHEVKIAKPLVESYAHDQTRLAFGVLYALIVPVTKPEPEPEEPAYWQARAIYETFVKARPVQSGELSRAEKCVLYVGNILKMSEEPYLDGSHYFVGILPDYFPDCKVRQGYVFADHLGSIVYKD